MSQPPSYVTRWDLDKTYLRTDFYELGELLQNVLERPDQKRPVPGAASLLRLLGAGPVRVHVLSGSPRQMRGTILKRFALDGVRVDELTLKPNASNLLRLRWRALRDQLGYKLTALLEARARELDTFSASPPEVLFGDDSEADAFVYSLYADVCTGQVDVEKLGKVLAAGDTYPDVARRALAAAERAHASQPEGAIFILLHLERQSPPSSFSMFGPRLVPFHNFAQASFVLLDAGFLSAHAVSEVCRDMLELHRFDVSALARSYVDLELRGYLSSGALGSLATAVSGAGPDLATLPESIALARREMRAASTEPVPLEPALVEPALAKSGPIEPLDYERLARAHRAGRSRR